MVAVHNHRVGFGTAALGDQAVESITMALESGFRSFDTAEADIWYNQSLLGSTLASYFEEEKETSKENTCQSQHLKISTKIPPWELTSFDSIRNRAKVSRKELVGWCDDSSTFYPLDIYYIHAPECWQGWHPRCNNVKNTLSLYDSWMAMEAVHYDHSAERIGLSNIWPNQLLELIHWIQQRQETYDGKGISPRMPDVLQAYADPLKPADELREICKQYNIEFVSYSTLGTQHRTPDGRNPVLNHGVLIKLAEKYDRSVAEVVLSWALMNDMTVIPRSTKEEHIEELSRLFLDGHFLDQGDLDWIDSIKLN
ncbi:hypothetical protein CTEN210_04220 [Chaetoceros tenuissimus]|uniref:NADP-dependent oxidoreductase domain-containing protein n=1 Tax=Chaetoceros tenuissimus TaxID=426638 RepID=A0AAD3CN35_9STRA|nr:hypothetical protein CTEN210_04220 [Chaetoceros tenuissimus]